MSYQDPYSNNAYYAGGSTNYHQPQYPPQPTSHNDNTGNDFNPYAPNVEYRQEQQPAQYSYQNNNNEEYRDDQPQYNYPPTQPSKRTPSRHTKKASVASVTVTPVRKHYSGFEQGEFTPTVATRRPPKTAHNMRNYRLDHQGNLWTKGGRGRCAGRICCCSLMTAIFLIVSVVLALALWVRPPSVKIWPVQLVNTANGTPISQEPGAISIHFGINITVNNPNYFSVDFKKIDAQIFYPLEGSDPAPIGSGELTDIVFDSTAQKNITFPFALTYKSAEDPQGKIILSLANKCGATGAPKGNINVNYKITLGIRILLITISPVISNSFSILCPLDPSDISKFLTGKT